MKIRISSLLIAFLCIFIVGCSKEKYNYKKSSLDKINILPGVSIKTTKDSYRDTVDSISIVLSNSTNENFLYGQRYTLEYYYKNNWVVVPFKSNISWDDIGYNIDKNSTKEIVYNIKDNISISSLELGKYRIVININSLNEKGHKDSYNLSAEFNIGV